MITRRAETALSISVVALFFLVRLTLLVVREPFFDELFTVWMAGRPFGAVLPALLLDSGPPLYYFVARVPNVLALRILSLVFATGTLALILTRKSIGNGRWAAAALLALYPPAALFAVDARAYALCGLFVAIGVIAVHEQRPVASALALLAAAYTHWYGALFLPLVLLSRAQSAEGRGQKLLRALRPALCALLFLPGLWLASRQPAAAMRWLTEQHPLAALQAFAFVGRYAEALFAPAPMALVLASAIVLLVAGARSWSFAPAVIVPVLLAVAFALAGQTVYFPMRFESVIAAPLVLWLARSLQWWRRELRWALTAALCVSGAMVLGYGALDHRNRPLDDYREAVTVLARNLHPEDRVVATGYLYLEAVHQLGEGRVQAWPAEQGRHPGWRAPVAKEPFPKGPLVWIVERGAPELAVTRPGRFQVLFTNDRAIILRGSCCHS